MQKGLLHIYESHRNKIEIQRTVIEATQSGEVVFTLILGLIFLGDPMPSLLCIIGIIIIVAGMIANSLAVGKEN